MIRQKPISFKIDNSILYQLDEECHISAMKRNNVLNLATGYYLDFVDVRRRLKCVAGNVDAQKFIIGDFLCRQFQNIIVDLDIESIYFSSK